MQHGLRPRSHLGSPAINRGRALGRGGRALADNAHWRVGSATPTRTHPQPPLTHASSLFLPCLQDAGTRSQGPVQLRRLQTPHHPHPTSHHSPARLASQMALMCSPAPSHPFLVPLPSPPAFVTDDLSNLLPACLLGLLSVIFLPPLDPWSESFLTFASAQASPWLIVGSNPNANSHTFLIKGCLFSTLPILNLFQFSYQPLSLLPGTLTHSPLLLAKG